jgi:hypothetical protein
MSGGSNEHPHRKRGAEADRAHDSHPAKKRSVRSMSIIFEIDPRP